MPAAGRLNREPSTDQERGNSRDAQQVALFDADRIKALLTRSELLKAYHSSAEMAAEFKHGAAGGKVEPAAIGVEGWQNMLKPVHLKTGDAFLKVAERYLKSDRQEDAADCCEKALVQIHKVLSPDSALPRVLAAFALVVLPRKPKDCGPAQNRSDLKLSPSGFTLCFSLPANVTDGRTFRDEFYFYVPNDRNGWRHIASSLAFAYAARQLRFKRRFFFGLNVASLFRYFYRPAMY